MKKFVFILYALVWLMPVFAQSPDLQLSGEVAFAQSPDLQLSGEVALALDVDTGEILFVKGQLDRQMYPASITKVMTALLLTESRQKGDILQYSARAKEVEPFKLDLQVGERLYACDAMDAILLFSANDIAYMIAENVGGDEPSFIAEMNRKAAVLGMKNTHFVTSNGLHDPAHYSSVYDLSILMRQMYTHPWLMESTCKLQETIISLENTVYELKNRNKLVLSGGCVGGKTGWTPEAGRCLAALYERDGRRIVVIVLNSIYDYTDLVVFRDVERLADWAYSCQPEELYPPAGVYDLLQTRYKLLPLVGPSRPLAVPLVVARPVREYTADPDFSVTLELEEVHPWRLSRNTSVGRLVVKGREIEHSYLLYPGVSAADLLKTNWLFYGLCLSALILLVSLWLLIFRRRRNPDRS